MRIRSCIFAFVTLVTLAGVSRAAVSAPGVNIRWDACFDDGGTMNKTFACDSNTGSERLVLSFVLDSPMSGVSGQEIVIDIASATAALPAWWQMKSPGTCRQTAISMTQTLPPGATNCIDWASGTAGGGVGAYNIGQGGMGLANNVRMVLAVAVPFTNIASLVAGPEYFNGSILISHAKTVGTGACSGCDVPVCIVYQSCKLTTGVAANDVTLFKGANWLGSQIAYWQNAYALNAETLSCYRQGSTWCQRFFSCVPYSATLTRGSTWGAVKSLYR